jgi:hypothetical protein
MSFMITTQVRETPRQAPDHPENRERAPGTACNVAVLARGKETHPVPHDVPVGRVTLPLPVPDLVAARLRNTIGDDATSPRWSQAGAPGMRVTANVSAEPAARVRVSGTEAASTMSSFESKNSTATSAPATAGPLFRSVPEMVRSLHVDDVSAARELSAPLEAIAQL